MSRTSELIELGNSYAPCWQLTDDELEKIAAEAYDGLCTMNGDTATVEITVKQFSLLLAARDKHTRLSDARFERG